MDKVTVLIVCVLACSLPIYIAAVAVSDTACTDGGTECDGIANAECDTAPNVLKCKCKDGFTENNDVCQADVTDAVCATSTGSEVACSTIDNADCVGANNEKCVCKTGTTHDSGVCTLLLGAACTNTDLKCTTNNAVCNTDNKCACKSDYIPNTDNTECEEKALEDACSADTDCQHELNAVCTNNKCSCADGYIPESDACKKVYGSSCSNTNSCPGLSNSVCADGFCKCVQFFEVENNVCVPVTVTDIDCSVKGNEDCPENAVCADNTNCECDVGFDVDGNKCAALEDACSADTDCQHELNAVCTNNKCSCADGYIPESNACTKVFGSTCTGTNACPGLSNSICSDKTCQCIPKYVEVENVCDLALTEIDCTVEGNECPANAMCNENKKCECDVDFVVENNQCLESGAASTKAMILMMFTVLLIRLVDKLLM